MSQTPHCCWRGKWLIFQCRLTVGEGDVAIRREECDQANNTANNGFQNCFAVKPHAHRHPA